MMWMADLLQNGTQCLLLASQLLVDEPAATLKLLFENPGAREPGKRDPSGKSWTVPAGGPVVALQSIGRRHAAARRGLEDGALRSGSRLAALRFANEAGSHKLFQRIVDLRPRNRRPIPDAAPLQLQIGFVTVHGALRQKAEQHEVRTGQCCLLLASHNYFVSIPLWTFAAKRFRSRLHYHHCHPSTRSCR